MTVDTDQAALVARQPILDANQRIFGYELLFRSGPTSAGFDGDADAASATVITQAILGHGLQSLTQGTTAFLNLTRSLLIDGVPDSLEPKHVVLEITEDIEADDEIINGCLALRSRGFKLALDDFELTEKSERLLPLADFVKVDFLLSDAAARRAITEKAGPKMVMLAEKIETVEAFTQAQAEGYTLYQGYFFGQPTITEGGSIPGHHLQTMRLLRGIQDPNLSAEQLEALIKSDVRMCYLVLRAANSAAAGVHSSVTSIRDAIVRVGRDAIRRWASMWLISRLGSAGHPELVNMAMTRAHGCEAIAGCVGQDRGDGFLVGLCSLLDAMLGRSMQELLEHLPLATEARAALMGEDNVTRRILDCVTATERADWDASFSAASRIGIEPQALASAYYGALRSAIDFGRTAAA